MLLLLVLTPLGVNVNGATRWLRLLLVVGPTYQPSEVAKLGIVLVFAAGMSKRNGRMPRLSRNTPQWKANVKAFLYWSDLGELVPLSPCPDPDLRPDAGRAPYVRHHSSSGRGGSHTFAAGVRLGWFAIGGAAIGVVGAIIVLVVGYNSSRIKTWLNPWWDPGDKGYQIVQSLYAVASGGLTGLGFGQSRQKYLYLPEEQNDFIFAIICEELGFIGAVLVIVLFALLIVRGYWLAIHARDRFGSLLIVGINTLLAVQVFLNIAGCVERPASYGYFAALLQLWRHSASDTAGGSWNYFGDLPTDPRA